MNEWTTNQKLQGPLQQILMLLVEVDPLPKWITVSYWFEQHYTVDLYTVNCTLNLFT